MDRELLKEWIVDALQQSGGTNETGTSLRRNARGTSYRVKAVGRFKGEDDARVVRTIERDGRPASWKKTGPKQLQCVDRFRARSRSSVAGIANCGGPDVDTIGHWLLERSVPGSRKAVPSTL